MPTGVSFSIPATDGTSGHATTQTSLFVHVPSSPSTDTTLFDYDLQNTDYFRLRLSTSRHLILEYQYTGYGSATADLGVLSVNTWTWVSCGFSTAGGLHIRGDVTPSGGGTTTVSVLASSGSAAGTTQTAIPFGVGVTLTSIYGAFPNNDAAGWLCSKLIQNQIASNAATGNPEPVPSTDFAPSADYREYLAHDPLGAALTLTDSGTGGIDLNAGALGLTIVEDGPPLLPSSPGPGGAHEGDLSIYKSGTWTTLHVGTAGQELTVAGGYPAWANDSGETLQQAGSTVAQRPIINFTSGATVTDDSANGRVNVAIASGGGSVTSVALVGPTGTTVSGSPVTGSGTLTLSWANQSANRVLAGPASGAAAGPTFRSLVSADLPISTSTTVGAIKPGTGLSVAGDGTLSLVPGAVLPSGAEGDVLIYRSGAWLGLAPGTTGQFLRMAGGYPAWGESEAPLTDTTGALVTDGAGNIIMA